MTRFGDLTLFSFLDAVASPSPTPGGGTAAALAGAMGASLVQMVAALPRTRRNSDEERAALAEAGATIVRLRHALLGLADRDSEAYDRVTGAYKLPKSDDGEKAARKRAVQQALREATLVPYETVRAAGDAIGCAKTVAQAGHASALSDVGVGLALLEAAVAGGAMNVRTNLTGIEDESFKLEIEGDLKGLLRGVSIALAEARSYLPVS